MPTIDTRQSKENMAHLAQKLRDVCAEHPEMSRAAKIVNECADHLLLVHNYNEIVNGNVVKAKAAIDTYRERNRALIEIGQKVLVALCADKHCGKVHGALIHELDKILNG